MKKRVTSIALAMSCCFTVLAAGCGEKEEGYGYIEGHKYPETLEVKLMSRDLYHNDGNTIGNDTIVQFFENKFNVKFKFLYAPSPSQTEVFEKMQMMISTGDIPDIMETSTGYQLSRQLYDQFSEYGYIVNSKEYVTENAERYPILYDLLNKEEVNTPTFLTTNGDLAMIPRYFGTVDHCFIIRKDWIDLYNGGKIPADYLELETMLSNFKKAKPGGVEQVGLTLPNTSWFEHIYAGFVGSQTWIYDEESKQYSHYLTDDGLKDAYNWLQRLSNDGLLDKAVFTSKGEEDAIKKMVGGFSGCTMMGLTYAKTNMIRQMEEANPDVEFCYVNLDGPKGKMLNYKEDYFEGCAIRSSFKDVGRLYDMIEFILSDEGNDLLTFGLEGVHYTMDGTEKVINVEAREAEHWYRRKHGLSALFSVETRVDKYFCDDYETIASFIESLHEENARIKNPLVGVVAKVERTNQNVLQAYDKADSYEIRFIKGELNINNNWSAYVNEINQLGLTKIVEDINSTYGGR